MLKRHLSSLIFAVSALGLGAAGHAASPAATGAAASSVMASNDSLESGLSPAVLAEALSAMRSHGERVMNTRYVGIIDYTRDSRQKRFFLFDTETGETETMLVAHGRNSDPAHSGVPTRFSNISGSKMTSLGSYVTGEAYHGKYGLSLRLHGLDASNDKAFSRAIVLHGADYVAPGRKLGRSWGCPAVERALAPALVGKIKDGAFLYIYGAALDADALKST